MQSPSAGAELHAAVACLWVDCVGDLLVRGARLDLLEHQARRERRIAAAQARAQQLHRRRDREHHLQCEAAAGCVTLLR